MRFATPWLVILFLVVASVASTKDLRYVSLEEPEQTPENGPLPTSASINKTVLSRDPETIASDSDVIMDELLFFETLVNGEKTTEENSVSTRNSKYKKSNRVDSDSENPVESKISADLIDIRRQGELQHGVKPGRSSGPDIQYEDSKEETVNDPPPRFGLRKVKQSSKEEVPVFQLTQGGYSRPFRKPRFRNRYISRFDSSEQSTQVQEPDRNHNEKRTTEARRVVPQVAYLLPSQQQQQQTSEPRPHFNPSFEAPRNMLTVQHMVPSTIQGASFFNAPPGGFAEFTTVPFRAHFPQSNEVGGFPNFARDSNSAAALFQVPQRNPFQAPAVMFQTTPEAQTQPILTTDSAARSISPQLQANPFTSYPGYENAEDNSRPNYAAFFRNPASNSQFEIPSNFYTAAPNTVSAFNSPPIGFLSNYPNSDDRLSSRFFRYPVTTEAQDNRQNSNDQQFKPDASHEVKKAKVKDQESVTPTNRDDKPAGTFGTRLQAQNEADVYMRYPTNEAGYAIEENLPSQNGSSEARGNSGETNSGQRNFPVDDPFRNGINPVLGNQRINNSYGYPPELFGNVPLDFGYQRPQNQIFLPYSERNREAPRYPEPNIAARRPFDPVFPLPENNYQFLNLDNQRQRYRQSGDTPSCAKQNNASICFEDSEYPSNDILYSFNSNSFLADRLSGQEALMRSVVLVERNATASYETPENYACAVETKYGSPMRAKNLEGAWRIIVNIQGKFSQPIRMEICKSLGDPCSYVDSRTKTTCVQKYSLQRLLSWIPSRGIYSDVYKVPVACSCQILKAAEI